MKKLFAPIILIILLFALPIYLGLIFEIEPDKDPNAPVKVKFQDAQTKKISEMNLEEYLTGVLAAEMPASYPKEALKAQAVAARSYILSRAANPNPQHPEAVVCTNPDHCKGYLTKKEALKKWSKDDGEEYWSLLEAAVQETCGQYLEYEGEVAQTFFFARSGGKTENSGDVWQTDLPYLKSVDSGWDAADDDHLSYAEFPHNKARELLHQFDPDFPLHSVPFTAEILSRTQGGSCNLVNICGTDFSGQDVRHIFGLKSANFDINVNDSSLLFTVRGYGHGVGMSQFGAKVMAEMGKTYDEILAHYYQSTNLVIP